MPAPSRLLPVRALPVRLRHRGAHAASRATGRRAVLPALSLALVGTVVWTGTGPAGGGAGAGSDGRSDTRVVALPAAVAPATTGVLARAVQPLPLGDPQGAAPRERASRSRRDDLPVPPPPLPPPPAPAAVRPVDGPLTSPYGPRWGRLHAGLDFGVPVGTPVRSVADGAVVEVLHERGGYGVSVRVLHPDGTLSLYAHLSEVLAVVGPVRAGDVIALSGNSGSSTGPHLHLELRGPLGPFDARPWLAARGVVV